MIDYQAFRAEMAAALRSCARPGWSAAAGPAADDRCVAASCERLAADAETLDLHLYLLCALAFTHHGLARRFYEARDGLLLEIRAGWQPAKADDLVRRALSRTLNRVAPAGRPRREIRSAPRAGSAMIAAADALTAWIGIVAPVLGLWAFGRGASQWSGQASVDLHSAVPAMIVSAEPVASVRHPPAAYDAVLSFRPSASSIGCEAKVRIGGASAPAAGTALMVVPRSSQCEPPLPLSEIGDPYATWGLAVALVMAGAVALKLRDRLGAAQTARRFRPPAAARSELVAVSSGRARCAHARGGADEPYRVVGTGPVRTTATLTGKGRANAKPYARIIEAYRAAGLFP